MCLNYFVRVLLAISLFVGMSFSYANATKLKTVSLNKGEIVMSMPTTFRLLKDKDNLSEYSDKNSQKISEWKKPKLVFTDNHYNNLIIDYGEKKLEIAELPQHLERFAQGFSETFPTASIYEKKIIEINKKKFALLKIKSPTFSGAMIYTVILYTSLDNKKVSFTMFLNEHNYKDWDTTMKKMITFIKIHGENAIS